MDGREQCFNADGQFDNAPYFNFNDDKVKFDTNDVDNANDNYGSASVSKSLLDTMPRKGALCYCFTDRIQPPSILPISSIDS